MGSFFIILVLTNSVSRIMKNAIYPLLFILVSIYLSCNTDNKCGEAAVDGIISDLSGLDGCRKIIELKTGEKLNPVNLDTFNIDTSIGREISVTYTVLEDMMSICMVGKMVEITCISNP